VFALWNAAAVAARNISRFGRLLATQSGNSLIEKADVQRGEVRCELNMGFGVQWNGYGKLSITVPLHPKSQIVLNR
jgi:hypothetical protein